MPHRTIGDTQNKEVLLQTDTPNNTGFEQLGTLDQWRNNISKFGIGNSVINFAISTSLTAPLIKHLGIEGGGFHFRGESSKGKTIALYVAGSVWGSQERKKTWRATANGLENTAMLHNDSILLLDEMGEMNSREIGGTVYMLANGQGKQRMTEPTPKAWRLLFLSTGEIDIKTAMLEAGQITKAGQEVRLIDLEAVRGKYGVFNNLLTGFSSSKDQAEHLQQQTKNYHGTAGIELLEHFIKGKAHALEYIKEVKQRFTLENAPQTPNSQVSRVLNRFAVIAGGGELATHYGVTGWEQGTAYQGAKDCFINWLTGIGDITYSQEHRQAIERIRLFIEQHGLSRFDDLDTPSIITGVTHDRAGVRKQEGGGIVYYFFPTFFKAEVCKGLDYRTVLNSLQIEGYLKHQSDRKTHLTPSFEGGRKQAYAIKSAILK